MPMPATHTNKMAATTRVTRATRTTITMTNITTKVLLASNNTLKVVDQEGVGMIQKKIQKHSATSQ